MECVILHRSFEQALAARKAVADDASCTSLGITFTTPDIFLAESWELWGDGRTLVSNRIRCLLLQDILLDYPVLSHISADIMSLARFVEHFTGIPRFEEVVAAAKFNSSEEFSLSSTEQSLFAALGSYFDRLDELGLIEPGHAAYALTSVMPSQHITCATWLDLPQPLRDLIETLTGTQLESLMPEPCIESVASSVETGFLFPSGPAATLPMIKDESEAFFEGLSTKDRQAACAAVCIPDPFDAYETLSPYFVGQDYTCSLKAGLPFARTEFGRAFGAVFSLVEGMPNWPDAATDFAYGPFSGMTEQTAQCFDTTVRQDRLITCEHVCELLRAQSNTFEFFEGLLSIDPLDSLAQLKRHVTSVTAAGTVPPYELRACQSLETLIEQCRQLDVSQLSLYDAANLLTVNVSMESFCDHADASVATRNVLSDISDTVDTRCISSQQQTQRPRIEFVSLPSIGCLARDTYDLVIVGDVSEDAFKAAVKCNAFDILAEKIGIVEDSTSVDAARASFTCAQHAARRRFTCVMPARDKDRETAYPAFLFNEYVSVLCREDEPIDETCFGLPERMTDVVCKRGEDAIAECLGYAFYEPCGHFTFDEVQRGLLTELSLAEFLPSVSQHNGVNDEAAIGADETDEAIGAASIPVLSPSAIETYIACPYRWFIDRRVRPSAIDEGFGPLERGTFVHEVYAQFFDALAERGITQLNVDCIDEADILLDEVFDDHMAACADMPGERYVPVNDFEELEVEGLRENMHVCLHRQTRLPKSFEVFEHELIIDPDDGIDYAGVRLNGRSDRVDIDVPAKHFVVLDYKGSIDGHEAGFPEGSDEETFVLPSKVQALIYAWALRSRFEGYTCVGALYLSYYARKEADTLAGSYNEPAYDVDSLTTAASEVSMNFDAFLNLIEEKITPYLDSLKCGDIQVNPRNKRACEYCGVPSCARRLQ